MRRIAVFLLVGASLTGCATRAPAEHEAMLPVARTPAAVLADSTAVRLAHLSRHDPARLDQALTELEALAQALDRPTLQAAREAAPPVSPEPVRPPPADLLDAPSLRHSVHLASYRLAENARTGWAELQADHPELQGHDARLERRDLGERGIFLRLKAGPLDTHEQAMLLCSQLESRGAYCMPVDFSGDPLTDREWAEGE